MKSLLALFPFSSGLGTSLQLSRVKNSLIANGQTWFLYSKWRLLTQHIQEFLQVTPGLPWFLGWGLGTRQVYTYVSRQAGINKVCDNLFPLCNQLWEVFFLSEYTTDAGIKKQLQLLHHKRKQYQKSEQEMYSAMFKRWSESIYQS